MLCWKRCSSGLSSFIALATIIILTRSSVLAEGIFDKQTGLGVTPPPGYEATVGPSRGRNTAVFDIKRTQDRDAGCMVAFQPVAQNKALTQAQINELVDTPERRSVIESSLGVLYQVAAVEQIEHEGVRGSSATATFKPIQGLPSRAAQMISLFYLLETPLGRTTVICISDKQNFADRRSEFDEVLRGITLPRQ